MLKGPLQQESTTWIIAAVTLAGVAAVLLLPPVPQDPAYHAFADRRTLLAIPNFWNVVSNLPFLVAGAAGLAAARRWSLAAPAPAYFLFCIAVMLVGAGSAWYHAAPSNDTLVWDRLPMTLAFMALFAIVIGDRISPALGRLLLWPLVAAGAASVLYWHWTELQGRGDLRAYGLVQFLPMLLMPLMVVLRPGRGLRAAWLWATLGAYALAKLAEALDAPVHTATGFLSGHSLKHLLAALAVLCALWAMRLPNGPGTGRG